MTELGAGDRLARLLLPYHGEIEAGDEPDHELGWWFTSAPPEIAQEALTLIGAVAAERPNDQPPEEWLVEQATQRGGLLAGFVCPAGPASPRMRIDAIIVPCDEAVALADEISKLWTVDDSCTALDLAVVEGLSHADDARRLWGWPGSDFREWRAGGGDWLDAAYCSFWWD